MFDTFLKDFKLKWRQYLFASLGKYILKNKWL